MLPFMKEGWKAGETLVHILDPDRRDERVRSLAKAGIDPGLGERSGRLAIFTWPETYLAGGRFDLPTVTTLVETIAKQETPGGLKRLWASMDFASLDVPGVEDVLEYESRINYLVPLYDVVSVCAYDISRFDLGMMQDILRVHPHVIIGGVARENPFYVPPDDFLPKLEAKKAHH
jgi:hypothetical protein